MRPGVGEKKKKQKHSTGWALEAYKQMLTAFQISIHQSEIPEIKNYTQAFWRTARDFAWFVFSAPHQNDVFYPMGRKRD